MHKNAGMKTIDNKKEDNISNTQKLMWKVQLII